MSAKNKKKKMCLFLYYYINYCVYIIKKLKKKKRSVYYYYYLVYIFMCVAVGKWNLFYTMYLLLLYYNLIKFCSTIVKN